MSDAPAVEQIDLVVFAVNGTRYAADLSQVRRIDVDEPNESIGAPLGQPLVGHRALVFSAGEAIERRLAIDHVFGVSRVPLTSLRRMPRAAHCASFAIGAWLDADETVLLVDLPSMISH